MRPYLILVIVIVLLAAVAIGCTHKKPPEPGESSGKFDDGSSGSGTEESGGSGAEEITYALCRSMLDEWTPEKKLQDIAPVAISVDASRAEPVMLSFTEEEVKVEGYTSYQGGVSSYASYVALATDIGSIDGLKKEIEAFNEKIRTRAELERAEGVLRHKDFQSREAEEDYIYLSSWISMLAGRSDSQVLSYITQVKQYNRDYVPDFYEVHGRTIDSATGDELSLNDFFTDVSSLPETIYERILPKGAESLGTTEEEVLRLIREAIEGCRDDGTFAWMVYPHAIEFYLLLKDYSNTSEPYLYKAVLPFGELQDILKPGMTEVAYDYINWILSKHIPAALGIEAPLAPDGTTYSAYYLVQKAGKRYLYGVEGISTTVFELTGEAGAVTPVKIGETLGEVDYMYTHTYFGPADPDHVKISCVIQLEQELYLVGEAHIAEDGQLVRNGLFEYRGNSIPFGNNIPFEAEVFADKDATESTVQTIPAYTDFAIIRSDGETFIDCWMYNADGICRLYITGSEEDGWIINGYPKDELLSYEGYWEE